MKQKFSFIFIAVVVLSAIVENFAVRADLITCPKLECSDPIIG